MKNFETPTACIKKFEIEDVMTTSPDPDGDITTPTTKEEF